MPSCVPVTVTVRAGEREGQAGMLACSVRVAFPGRPLLTMLAACRCARLPAASIRVRRCAGSPTPATSTRACMRYTTSDGGSATCARKCGQGRRCDLKRLQRLGRQRRGDEAVRRLPMSLVRSGTQAASKLGQSTAGATLISGVAATT